MEGGGTGLKRETDVGCLGQRKGEAARRKKRKTERARGEKQSKLRGKKEKKELEEEQGSSLERSELQTSRGMFGLLVLVSFFFERKSLLVKKEKLKEVTL